MKYLSAKTVLLAVAVTLLMASFNLSASSSNKWRLKCNGKAHSDGTIVLRITPKGGEAITAEIAIKDKTSENDVAKTLVKGLKAILPKDTYHVERDDGEDVLVKKKFGKDDFLLEIVSNDVEHVGLKLKKE